jgi:mono/diheme cytochrome c family protein
MKKQLFSPVYLTLFGLMLMAFGACSGNANSGDNSANATSAPTQTLFPTYSFAQPTVVPEFSTVAAATSTAASGTSISSNGLDPEKVAKGLDRYTKLQCASCHGENGEGVTDKGKALTDFAMSQDDFITFMRSGGSVGRSHQYATNRLSDSGGKNLYEYLKSLVTK